MPLPGCPVTVLAGDKKPGLADGRGTEARFKFPGGLKMDAQDNAIVSDMGNGRICRVTPDGVVTTLVGNRPGTTGNPDVQTPAGFALDTDGSIIFTDMGFHQVRRLAPDGTCSVVAGCGTEGHRDGPAHEAKFMRPHAICIHPDGGLVVVDSDDCRIRRVSPRGTVSTLSGRGYPGHQDGPLHRAEFNKSSGVRVFPDGAILVMDAGNNCLRRISTDGMVTTLAGCPEAGLADGPAGTARFNHPSAVVFDGYGNLLVSDVGNNCLRLVAPDGYTTTLRTCSPEAPSSGAPFCCVSPAGQGIDVHGDIVVISFRSHRVLRVHAGLQPLPSHAPNHRLLDRLLTDALCADLCFVVGRHRLPAHRCVIAATWPAASRPPLRVSDDGSGGPLSDVAIADADPDAFRALLRFLYTGELCGLDGILPLMQLMAQYEMREGYHRCLRLCYAYITPRNAVQWLVDAWFWQLSDVVRFLAQYVVENHERIQADAPETLASLERCPEAQQELQRLRAHPDADLVGPGPDPPATARVDPPTRLLQRLWLEKEWADVTFVVGEERIDAHRCVLAGRCEYFASLLAAGFAEANNAEIPLCDTSASAWRAFLHFLYTEELPSDVAALEVLQLCHTYSHTEGYDHCFRHCTQCLTPGTAVAWLAATHHLPALEDFAHMVLRYVQDHRSQIHASAPDSLAVLQPSGAKSHLQFNVDQYPTAAAKHCLGLAEEESGRAAAAPTPVPPPTADKELPCRNR